MSKERSDRVFQRVLSTYDDAKRLGAGRSVD
ncbi:hypothetical protein BURPS1710b_A1617 [Burkholderia pseudomallei 1710b]|uniref:Uncharacterized protein n=1 Tax=Burkholderia pseudomallei (strain 1710b) TaxID=320372 RepID=Q3JI29_BURP1|nr:hypothetical protein BURPS1710b_A1617 [Burkholderia pseudomallei 1710b]